MLGPRVRAERTRRGWTQQGLAERADVSVRTVREVERGRVAPSGGASVRLAELLGLDVADDGLYVGLLGPLVVRLEDVAVGVTAEKQRSLLGLLALHAGQVVSRYRIADVLWGARPPATWRNLVHTYVARLRSVLSHNAIIGIQSGYQLDGVRCDVADFDDRAAAARRRLDAGDLDAAERELRGALALWRGPVLDDLHDRVRVDPVIAAIAARRTVVALAHADVALRLGRFTEAVTSLSPVVHDQPSHEPLRARLIVALAGDGQQVAALRLFDRFRCWLADEMGVDPGRELREAHEQVLHQELPGHDGSHRTGDGRGAIRPRNMPRLCGSA